MYINLLFYHVFNFQCTDKHNIMPADTRCDYNLFRTIHTNFSHCQLTFLCISTETSLGRYQFSTNPQSYVPLTLYGQLALLFVWLNPCTLSLIFLHLNPLCSCTLSKSNSRGTTSTSYFLLNPPAAALPSLTSILFCINNVFHFNYQIKYFVPPSRS